jgi:hypothetical protein
MTSKRIILLTICVLAILVLGSLTATILYYYHHPSALKRLIERSVSRSTGTSLTIGDLSYSTSPLSVQARGIICEPSEGQHGFYASVPDVKADMVLTGRFGHKMLTFTDLRLTDFSVHLSGDMVLPKISPKSEMPPSLFSRVLKQIVHVFIFRRVTFQSAEVINGKIAFQSSDQMVDISDIQATISPDHGVDASCNARAKWPGEKMHLIIPSVHVTSDDALSPVDQEMKGRLQVKGVTFESAYGNIQGMDVGATLTFDRSRENLAFDQVHVRFRDMTINDNRNRSPVSAGLELTAQGSFDLQENQVDVFQFHLVSEDLLDLTGALGLRFGTKQLLQVTRFDGHLLPGQCLSILHDTMGVRLPPFTLSGPVNLHGDLECVKENETWRWQGDMEVLLSQNHFSYAAEDMHSAGRISGNLRAQGSFPDMELTARLKGDEVTFAGMGINMTPSKARVSLSGRYPLHLIEEIQAEIPKATVDMGNRDVDIRDIRVHTQGGSVNAQKGLVSLSDVRLTSSLLKSLHLALSMDKERILVDLKGKNTRLAEAILALGLVPSGWEFSGLDSLNARVVLKDGGRLALTSKLGFKDFAFTDGEGNRMGEGILVEARSEADIDLNRSDVTANTTLEIDQGEVLWDNFYFNLAKNPFSISLKGAYGIEKKSLHLSEMTFGLKDILGLHVHGSILHQVQDPSMDLMAKIEETPLKPIYRHFVSEPFRMQKPFLASMNTKGSISADIGLTGTPNDLTAKGSFTWHDGELLSADSSFSLQGIELELPLWYQAREGKVGEETIQGKLSVQSMILPCLPEQPLNLSLDIGPNRLFVRSPTTIAIPGGDVIIGPVTCENIFGAKKSVRTSLEVTDTEINELLPGIWSSPIQGTIGGRLDPVYFEADTLTSHGEVKADAFGGQLILSGIRASRLSSSGPVFRFDAKWSNLSLAELTTDTSFGRIEGVLQGHVKGMEIAYGQPQAFDLLLETVKTKGVPQKISVKAVDNIAQIGGGTSPFMGLAGQFARLFKNFPYTKIGVHASLQNDVFQINGTVRDGGREYLVKRGRFSGINVVNQNPDNRVRFKDMVKRVKRVTDSGSGPVTK